MSAPGPREVSAAGTRVIHEGDGVAWLQANGVPADAAVVTSLPDHSEVPEMGVEVWRRWFADVVKLICEAVDERSVAVFYQTDVKHDGYWIDKSYLVGKGVEAAGSQLLWHKIVCRGAPGSVTFGRPAYTHMLCASRGLRLLPGQSTADVLPERGTMPWARAMGEAACVSVAQFLRAFTGCRTVVDPFCGVGTMLAVANREGFDAIGVELSRKRARKARELDLAAR